MTSAGNVYQFIDLPRVEPPKVSLKERKESFNVVYRIFSDTQAVSQADRCLSCGNPYCQNTCPVSNHIPDWLKLVYENRIIEAAELSHLTNSLPEVCGRVCPQERLCEGSCTLQAEYGAVTIGGIEEYITETAFAMGWRPSVTQKPKQPKKVAVVGSGPAGLACADFLNRNGVAVTVYERECEIGGLLTFGIPAFKLDKRILVRRRQIFEEAGIRFCLQTEVGRDIACSALLAEYDAVFMALGTYQSLKANIPNEEAKGVYSALPFLIANTKHLLGYEAPDYVSMEGKRVLVLGGGDTAMDCVRSSIRQGASSVYCVYRRDEKNMPGSRKEFENAREEGAQFSFNLQPLSVEVDESQHVKGLWVGKTRLGQPDCTGRQIAELVPNSQYLLEADAIIVAFGFVPHTMSWLEDTEVQFDRRGRIITDQALSHQTHCPKIFAGGDVTRGSDLVVTAIMEGRNAAFSILNFLKL